MAFDRRYVPVAERRAQAGRKLSKLRAAGTPLQPIRIEGRTIARNFWGKRWCDHLESFSDYANRLPRGRTYVRNGSVCHLEIASGLVKAKVAGTRLYTVSLRVAKLKAAAWKSIKSNCSGQIDSVLELLRGSLSDHVMEIVTSRDSGLFPAPREITVQCSCPDWAQVCKHVAAVFYGVGNRLDHQPELLFLLRGVDPAELTTEMVLPDAAPEGDDLADAALGEIFDIELNDPLAGAEAPEASTDGPQPATENGRRRTTRSRTSRRRA